MAAAAERVREVRDRLFATASVLARADGVERTLFPVAIPLAEGLALRERIRGEGARRTLEVGLGFGIATLFICEGLLANGPDARHLAIDPFQFAGLEHHGTSFASAGLQVLEDAGVRGLVEFHAQESQILLPRLLSEGRRFDLAFIDGNQRFEAVFLDLVYCGRLLGEGRIVVVDDTHFEAIRSAVGFCTANLSWAIEDAGSDGPDHAWMVLRTGPEAAFRRPFTEHRSPA